MNKEDKDLLLKDLLPRIPHNLQVEVCEDENDIRTVLGIIRDAVVVPGSYGLTTMGLDDIKPILRPLSSMTKEETNEFKEVSGFTCYRVPIDGVWFDNDITPFCTFCDEEYEYSRITQNNVIAAINWLNKKGFDYSGLIDKNLAKKR
jgi:hypothetical protein